MQPDIDIDQGRNWKISGPLDDGVFDAYNQIRSAAHKVAGENILATWEAPAGYVIIGEGSDSEDGTHRFELCCKAVETTYTAYDTDTIDYVLIEFWAARLLRSDYSLVEWINVSPEEPTVNENFRDALAPSLGDSFQISQLSSFSQYRFRVGDGLAIGGQRHWVKSGTMEGMVFGALWLPDDRLMLRVDGGNQIACWDLATGDQLWIKKGWLNTPLDLSAYNPDSDPQAPPWGVGFGDFSLSHSVDLWDVVCQLSDTTVLCTREKQFFTPQITSAFEQFLEWDIEVPAWATVYSDPIISATAVGVWASKWYYKRLGSPDGPTITTPTPTVGGGSYSGPPWFGEIASETNGGELVGSPEAWDSGITSEPTPLPESYYQFTSRSEAEDMITNQMRDDLDLSLAQSTYDGMRPYRVDLHHVEINFITGDIVQEFKPHVPDGRASFFETYEANLNGASEVFSDGWGTRAALDLTPHYESECYLLVENEEEELVPDRSPVGTNENFNGYWHRKKDFKTGLLGGFPTSSINYLSKYGDYSWFVDGTIAGVGGATRTAFNLKSCSSGSLPGETLGGKQQYPSGSIHQRDTGGEFANPPYPEESHSALPSTWYGMRVYASLSGYVDGDGRSGSDRRYDMPAPYHSSKALVFEDRLIFVPRCKSDNYVHTQFRSLEQLFGDNSTTPLERIKAHNKEVRESHWVVCYKRDTEGEFELDWALNTFDLIEPAYSGESAYDEELGDFVDKLSGECGDCRTSGFVCEDGRLYLPVRQLGDSPGDLWIRVPVVDIDGGVGVGTVEASSFLAGSDPTTNKTFCRDLSVLAQGSIVVASSVGADNKFYKLLPTETT